MRRLHDRRVRIRWAFLVACIALPLGLAAAASTGGETKHGLPVARIVEARGVSGEPDRLFDALVKPEGALWNSKGTLVLTSLDSALIIDLGAPTQVSGILLQGDNNDRYAIDASEDGHGWMTALVSYKSEEGAGLRTRCHRLPSPVSMRFARIRPETGDGKYSLSELQFYSTIPDAWPPPLKIDSQLYPIVLPGSILMSDVLQLAVLPILALLLLSPRTVRIQAKRTPALFGVGALLVVLGAHGWVHRNSSEWFDRERYLIQIGLMLVAILLSKAGGMSCKRRGEEMLQPNTDDHSGQVTRTGCASGSSSGSRSSANLLSRLLLVSTLCLSIGCYLNFGRFHGNNRIHYYDFTHYLLGSVYFEEMGYHGLYLALLQADQEGRGFLDPDSEIRNLEINKLVKSREFTSQSIQIKERFSPERWKAFQADVDYFQGQLGREGFQKLVKDHGYNPSPIWTMVGGTLGRLLASTGRGTAFCAEFLSFLDPILLLTAVLALILATGVEAG